MRIITCLLAILALGALGAAEIPAGTFRAVTLHEKPTARVDTPLLEKLQGEVGALEVERVGDDNAMVRSGGQMLWLKQRDEDTCTFEASWTEGAEIFTRRIVIPFHAEDGVRIGGIVDEWSGGRRVERVVVLVAD